MKEFDCLYDVDLKNYNTYGIATKTKYLIKPQSKEELIDIINYLNKSDIPWYVLGGGSNVILPDKAFDGAIIKLDHLNDFVIKDDILVAGAGLNLMALILKLIDLKYVNLTPLYGIPGTLGGAIVGNAGSFKHNIFEYIISAFVLDNGVIKEISKENIFYEDRNTEFKNSKVIVLGAKIKLEKGNKEEAYKIIKENMQFRKCKQPLEYKNAGSVFKNPEGDSAGRLIDECGLKGYNVNDACISNKHANFIINLGNATSNDIINLITYIKEEVKKEKNIDLILEQVIVNW